VLRLIDMTLKSAQAAGVPACICGQMSGAPHYALLLLGLGLTEFSLPSANILEIKRVFRNVTHQQCRDIAKTAMQMQNAQEIDAHLKEELKKLVPQLVP
jgi:phosphoenolpyruvate-protein kinase (PTS system EI component)